MQRTTEVGLVAGIDPHKRTLTVTVLDERGGALGTRTFKVSGDGHRAMCAWAADLGPVRTWGVEGASALGRHTAVFLGEAGFDVRDVCPTRTAEQARRRRQGKTDNLDAERIAREVLADPDLPAAFKRAPGGVGPDPVHDQMSLWHKARRSLLKTRQHVLNEAESVLIALPEHVQDALGDDRDVRRRLKALADLDRTGTSDPVVTLRLVLLDQAAADVAALDARDKKITAELAALVATQGSTLDGLCGLSTKGAVELLVETGDPRRFTEGGYARFNGTAPIPRLIGRGRRRAGPSPTRPRRQPADQRRPSPHGHHPAPLQPGRPRPVRTGPAEATPSGRPCGSSSGTSPTLSTARCSGTPSRTAKPTNFRKPLDIGASAMLGTALPHSRTPVASMKTSFHSYGQASAGEAGHGAVEGVLQRRHIGAAHVEAQSGEEGVSTLVSTPPRSPGRAPSTAVTIEPLVRPRGMRPSTVIVPVV